MDDELCYSRYDYTNKETENSRNGYCKKKVVSYMGEMHIPSD